MRYRRFGQSELEVSEVGFGVWTLASDWWGHVEDKQGMLHAALDAGINFIDTAPKAAGVIHTDFEKGFIRAEVIAYDDYVALKGEHGAKEAGKMRLEGKDYVVRDGDVMHFRFNV